MMRKLILLAAVLLSSCAERAQDRSYPSTKTPDPTRVTQITDVSNVSDVFRLCDPDTKIVVYMTTSGDITSQKVDACPGDPTLAGPDS